MEEEEAREIVVPGETIENRKEFIAGEGTRKEGNEIVAERFGVVDRSTKLLKVIPLSGVYIPRKGNTVIGQVIDITFNGWFVDIRAPHLGFLTIAECGKRVIKEDLSEYYKVKDILLAKVKSVKTRSIELTMKERGLKKLDEGLIILVNPTRVPRIIGRAGSMVNLIKKETNTTIVVGQNGVIWIKGKNVENELLAKKAIELVSEKPFIEGLTEKVKEFLENEKAGWKK